MASMRATIVDSVGFLIKRWWMRFAYGRADADRLCGVGTGDEWNPPNSARAGADYITSVYNEGRAHGDWDWMHQHYGNTYPFDAVSQHIYLYTTTRWNFPANAATTELH